MLKDEAIIRGLFRYDSPVACSKGHRGQRIVATDECAKCMIEDLNTPRIINPPRANTQLEPMRRKDAVKLRLNKYIPFTPCAKGHHTFRYTNTGACVACIAGYAKENRLKHAIPRIRFKKVTIAVHADDIETIKGYAEALRLAREFDAGID